MLFQFFFKIKAEKSYKLLLRMNLSLALLLSLNLLKYVYTVDPPDNKLLGIVVSDIFRDISSIFKNSQACI